MEQDAEAQGEGKSTGGGQTPKLTCDYRQAPSRQPVVPFPPGCMWIEQRAAPHPGQASPGLLLSGPPRRVWEGGWLTPHVQPWNQRSSSSVGPHTLPTVQSLHRPSSISKSEAPAPSGTHSTGPATSGELQTTLCLSVPICLRG